MIGKALAALLMLAAAAPEAAPLPRVRPELANGSAGMGASAPLPFARPASEKDEIAQAADPPPPQAMGTVDRAPALLDPPAVRPGLRPGVVCQDTRIEGAAIPAIREADTGCELLRPVRVTAVAGVRLDPAATLDCTAARSLAAWVDGPVRAAAEDRLGAGIKSLRVYASYACRGRNNRAGAKLSEHAFGRAVDVGAFSLSDERRVSVLSGWETGDEGAFLAAIRETACGPFTTVLGPGSDEYHADHFHLDVAERQSPYCR